MSVLAVYTALKSAKVPEDEARAAVEAIEQREDLNDIRGDIARMKTDIAQIKTIGLAIIGLLTPLLVDLFLR